MSNKKTLLSIKLAALCLVASMMLFTGCNENTSSEQHVIVPSVSTGYSLDSFYPDNLPGNTKNIILMIPDGIGHESMKVVDYYMNGEAESQIYNGFPVQVSVETSEYEYIYELVYGTDEEGNEILIGYDIIGYEYYGYDPDEAWSDFNYQIWYDPLTDYFAHYPYVNRTTDSASASTAMATGYKTKDAAMSYGVIEHTVVGSKAKAEDFVSLTNITQIAEMLGKAAGVISTVPLSHATPGAQVAHHIDRNQYAAIADEMIFESKLAVIMGPGIRDYDHNGNPYETPEPGKYISDATIAKINDWYDDPETIPAGGFNVVRTRAEFTDLADGKVTPPARLLGIPQVEETNNYYANFKYVDSYYVPFTIPQAAGVPTLAEMSKAALNVLNQYDDNGFYLMIEGGAVDWANHFGWLYRVPEEVREVDGETPGPWGILIEEMDDFNKAVEAVVEWVEANSNWNETLLIVVPDHDTGFVWGEGSGNIVDEETGEITEAVFNPVINNGKGNLPGFNWYTWWHSNHLVPLYAKGAGADRFMDYIKGDDPVYGGYIDNIDIFKVMHYSFLKNKIAPLIAQARTLRVDDETMLSRLLAADLALDKRRINAASQHLEGFIDAVNADASLAASGMAEAAESIVEAIEPHVNNPGW